MNIAGAVVSGLVTGIFFYYGLWLTVRALPVTHHPVLLTISSFWLRTAATLAALLFAMHGSWQNAIAFLGGFGLGRVAVSLILPRGSKPCI